MENIVLLLLAISSIICVLLTIHGQRIIMSTHNSIVDLIKTFKREVQDSIKDALAEHVKLFHK